MKLTTTFAAAAMLITRAAATVRMHPLPFDHDITYCDGLTQPRWSDCDDLMTRINPRDGDGFMVGPYGSEGESFTNGNCTIRFLQCNQHEFDYDEPWEIDTVTAGSMYRSINGTCGPYNAGGGYRYSDACIVVESPRNPFPLMPDEVTEVERGPLDNVASVSSSPSSTTSNPGPTQKPDDDSGGSVPPPASDSDNDDDDEDQQQQQEPPGDPSWWTRDLASSPKKRDAQRPVSKRRAPTTPRNDVFRGTGLSKRQRVGCDDCEAYRETVIIKNVRGPSEFVCDDVLSNGDSCQRSRTITIQESYTVGVEMSGNFADVISLGASFTYGVATSSSEATTANMEMSGCPNGGYFIWYPMMEISKGRCGHGRRCDGAEECMLYSTDTTVDCELSRAIEPREGVLSGEYATQCR